MALSTTPSQLVTQKELCTALRVGKTMIDDRVRRYPPDSEHPFPVERLGRNRRYDVEKVRAWFAAEAEGFISAA